MPARGPRPGMLLLLLAVGTAATQAAHLPRAARHLTEDGQGWAQAVRRSLQGIAAGGEAIPGIQLAARQAMFDYGTHEGLEMLKESVQRISIPEVSKAFNLPIVGDFSLKLYNIQVAQFNISSEEARLTIQDGTFSLVATQVEADVSFSWHWEKLGMSGTGVGELLLKGGRIEYTFTVVNEPTTRKPQISVANAASSFETVELSIKSSSADWLYQAVMTLFNDQIQKAVQNGINGAMRKDVPGAINNILSTLPTKLEVQGLPFSTSFEYSIYALTYVMVKGFGEVESDQPALAHQSMHSHRRQLLSKWSERKQRPGMYEGLVGQVLQQQAQVQQQQQAGQGLRHQAVGELRPCPFEVSPALPLNSDEIGADSHQTSLYLHESVVNCMLWGLYRSNLLKYNLTEGSIPNLHITTDLLAMLIPELPKKYPHQFLKIDVEALTNPRVSFSAVNGSSVTASYRLYISVANETLGNPKIARLSANLTIQGQLNWDSTVITSVVAKHTVEEASLMVAAPQWDGTVAWFVSNYGGLFPLQQLVTQFVKTPVASLVGLVNTQAATYDRWFALSGDIQLHRQARHLL